MNKQTQLSLLKWFHTNKREMPWRENPTPYRVWISEIMLQQTTVATVKEFYLRFIEKFPTLEKLSKANEDEVLLLWAGLGYYSRAKNILKTAQLLQKEDQIPSEFEELKKLPGIGPYTAGAVSSIAFNKPVSLIDTNVDRVLGRFFTLDRQDKDFEQILRSKAQLLIETVPTEEFWAWNQAIMELGALVCMLKSAECDDCPLKLSCGAYRSGEPWKFPGNKVKSKIESITEYALIIKKKNNYLISKITSGTRRRGLYDFPIVNTKIGEKIDRVSYRISNNKVERIFCLVDEADYKSSLDDVWVNKNNFSEKYALVSPCKKFFLKICK